MKNSITKLSFVISIFVTFSCSDKEQIFCVDYENIGTQYSKEENKKNKAEEFVNFIMNHSTDQNSKNIALEFRKNSINDIDIADKMETVSHLLDEYRTFIAKNTNMVIQKTLPCDFEKNLDTKVVVTSGSSYEIGKFVNSDKYLPPYTGYLFNITSSKLSELFWLMTGGNFLEYKRFKNDKVYKEYFDSFIKKLLNNVSVFEIEYRNVIKVLHFRKTKYKKDGKIYNEHLDNDKITDFSNKLVDLYGIKEVFKKQDNKGYAFKVNFVNVPLYDFFVNLSELNIKINKLKYFNESIKDLQLHKFIFLRNLSINFSQGFREMPVSHDKGIIAALNALFSDNEKNIMPNLEKFSLIDNTDKVCFVNEDFSYNNILPIILCSKTCPSLKYLHIDLYTSLEGEIGIENIQTKGMNIPLEELTFKESVVRNYVIDNKNNLQRDIKNIQTEENLNILPIVVGGCLINPNALVSKSKGKRVLNFPLIYFMKKQLQKELKELFGNSYKSIWDVEEKK